MSHPKAIGIFGGTFDPIHSGHLRAALEVFQGLKLDEMRLIPCHVPPHRAMPIASGVERLEMTRLSVLNSALQVDDQEMGREGPSYTVDTLQDLRKKFYKSALYLVVGVDAFLNISSWHQWEKLIQLANIVVIHRTGWDFPEQGEMMNFLKEHLLTFNASNAGNADIHAFSSGKVIMQTITSLDIQASRIRNMIALGESPQFLLPDQVLKYIQKNGLYGYKNHDRLKTNDF